MYMKMASRIIQFNRKFMQQSPQAVVSGILLEIRQSQGIFRGCGLFLPNVCSLNDLTMFCISKTTTWLANL